VSQSQPYSISLTLQYPSILEFTNCIPSNAQINKLFELFYKQLSRTKQEDYHYTNG